MKMFMLAINVTGAKKWKEIGNNAWTYIDINKSAFIFAEVQFVCNQLTYERLELSFR